MSTISSLVTWLLPAETWREALPSPACRRMLDSLRRKDITDLNDHRGRDPPTRERRNRGAAAAALDAVAAGPNSPLDRPPFATCPPSVRHAGPDAENPQAVHPFGLRRRRTAVPGVQCGSRHGARTHCRAASAGNLPHRVVSCPAAVPRQPGRAVAAG